MYEQLIESLAWFIEIVGHIITSAGIIVVLWGFLLASKEFIMMKFKQHSFPVFFRESSRIRALLGTYILFGLEFMIAADILHTFIKPELEELITLAIVVAIRTVISYFLSKEVDEAKHGEYCPSKKPAKG